MYRLNKTIYSRMDLRYSPVYRIGNYRIGTYYKEKIVKTTKTLEAFS